MKIPYIQKIGIGLHITDDAIRWVQLSRIGSRITIKEAEYLEIGNRTTAEVLTELIEKIQPRFRHVAVNMDFARINRLVIDVPELEDDHKIDRWIAEAEKEVIPEGYSPDRIAVTHHIFGDTETGLKCLLLSVPVQVLEERMNLIKSAGLEPIIITEGGFESRYAVMFDEAFNHSNTLFLSVFEDQACLQQLKDGLLEQYYPFTEDVPTIEDGIQEVESLVVSQSSLDLEATPELFLSGSRKFRDPIAESDILEIKKPKTLGHLVFQGSCLAPDYAIACGMAVKQLYPDIDALNFLQEAEVTAAGDEIQKRDTLSMGMALGMFLLVVGMSVFWIQMYLDFRIDEVNGKVEQVEDKVALVSEARSRVVNLKKQVVGARELIRGRTNTAVIIEEAGRALPKGTWLTELMITNRSDTAKTFDVRMNGYAENEALITAVLEKLESKSHWKQVRLYFSEQMDFNDVYDTGRYRNRALVYFDIRMQQKINTGDR